MKNKFAVINFVIFCIYALGICPQQVSAGEASKVVLEHQKKENEKLRKVTMYYPGGYEELVSDYKESVRRIFREVNVELTFKSVPSERGINMLISGESLAELARSSDVMDAVKENYFFISTPVDILELSYVYRDKKFKKFDSLDTKNVVVGYMQGGRTSKKAAERFVHVHALKDRESLSKMLESGRLDLFFILTNKQQRELISQRGFQVGFINKHPIYSFLRRDLEAYRDKLNSAYLREFKH